MEESDDDEEFENIREDKFVFLDKSVTMECSFQKRTNTYVPLKIVQNGQIATMTSMDESKQHLEQSNMRKNVQRNSYNNNNHNNSNRQSNYHSNNSSNSNQSHNQSHNNHRGQRQTYNSHSQINHYRQSFNQ